jgi:hypothetical protein
MIGQEVPKLGSLAYPLVVLILGLVGMVLFKRPLSNLINRSHKLGLGGLEASASPPQQMTAESSSTITAVEAGTKTFEEFQQAMSQYRYPTAVQKVEEFRREVSLESVTHDQLLTIVTEMAGYVMMTVDFERIYTLIFGSQIALLAELNGVFAIGSTRARARAFYDHTSSETPGIFENFSFEQWLGFLTANGLVTLEHNGEILKITGVGRDFLRYLVQAGKQTFKPY